MVHGLKTAHPRASASFFSENHRLVFWYDPEQSFGDELANLDLPDVQVVDMAGESSMALKLKLELEDQSGRYLLYFPTQSRNRKTTGCWT